MVRKRAQKRAARRNLTLVGLAAGGAGIAVTVLRRRGPSVSRPVRAEWSVVTVDRDVAELTGDDRPPALIGLAKRHDVRITRAPGDWGSEIAVRGTGSRTRRRLRQVKQVLEAGEALRVRGQPEGHRTLRGRVSLFLIRHVVGHAAAVISPVRLPLFHTGGMR
jgi:hypothetical protein